MKVENINNKPDTNNKSKIKYSRNKNYDEAIEKMIAKREKLGEINLQKVISTVQEENIKNKYEKTDIFISDKEAVMWGICNNTCSTYTIDKRLNTVYFSIVYYKINDLLNVRHSCLMDKVISNPFIEYCIDKELNVIITHIELPEYKQVYTYVYDYDKKDWRKNKQ